MAKLKPWYQVVTPREDLRENRALEASEFAVHIDHIRTGRDTVSKDYSDPARFFERTYLTGSLLELTSQVVRRLNGIQLETSAVFNMATQFGGGKTHSLTTLYHLAEHGDEAKKWKGVDNILSKAGVTTIPKTHTAVFVGTEFDAITGRKGDGEPTRKTPWGEIAWQLGGSEAFAKVAKHDAQGVSPAGDVLRDVLPTGPTLILMDELLNYISSGRKLGLRDQFFNFLQNLCEEARARNNLAMCISIPRSDLEMNPDDQRDHDSIKKLCDRTGKAILMSADREMQEIIRRRLFEWDGLSKDALATISAYAEWAAEHSQELAGVDRDAVYERFKACYPFHPSVISVFERKWQSLPRFQRTRGVLRLLALWVSHNYQEDHRKNSQEPLITLGLAPLDNPTFRAAIFEQLGSSELEIPVTTDIAGKTEAHGIKLDKEANETMRKAQLHRKVATAIFFESNGGMSQAHADASLPEIKSAVGSPDQNLVDVDNALEGLASSCYYLNWDRNRYRFGLVANLNQMLVNRRGLVAPKAIDERIKQQTQTLFDKKTTDATKLIERKYFPARSNDVPSRPALTLCVMGLDQPFGEKSTTELIESIIRDCGGSGRTYKSALLFSLADAGNTVQDAARNLLAWEDIDDDGDAKKRWEQSDPAQLKLLSRNLANAKRDLDEAIFRACRHVCLLGKDNKLQHVDLGQITSSAAGCLVELILRDLGKVDITTEGVSPSKLLKYWPPALVEWSTQSVRDAFYSSPQLPRLLNPDAIKRTICDGVTQGAFGYASKDANGKIKLEKLKESLFDNEVEIADDFYIIKEADAKKLKEPPRLATLTVRPEHVVLKVGEQASFSCSGVDQYGQPFAVTTIKWSGTGGEVTTDGLFTAGQTGGVHTVRAEVDGLESLAEVRITTKDDPTPPPPLPGEHIVRWRGEVPAQKWMNFYTKVLSKYATSPDLKLEVSFSAKVDREQADAKAGETKSALRELGLDDDVSST